MTRKQVQKKHPGCEVKSTYEHGRDRFVFDVYLTAYPAGAKAGVKRLIASYERSDT